MKLFLFLLGMVVAGILGYAYEPNLRFQLTGNTPEIEKPQPKKLPEPIAETPEFDTPGDEPAAKIDPASYSADQLPEKILLNADVEIVDATSDIKMTVTAGNRLNLIRLEGENAVVSPGAGPFEGVIPINQTDLLEQLAALPNEPTPAPVEPVEPAVVAEVEPDSVPAEPEVTEPMPAPEPRVEPKPEPRVEPKPEPKPEPAPTGATDVVSIMKESIQSGAIKEFTFDQVLDWTANAEAETIEGESYETGIASYKAETVFGVKTITAKALIQDGKVVRWLWPKSGMEIK